MERYTMFKINYFTNPHIFFYSIANRKGCNKLVTSLKKIPLLPALLEITSRQSEAKVRRNTI